LTLIKKLVYFGRWVAYELACLLYATERLVIYLIAGRKWVKSAEGCWIDLGPGCCATTFLKVWQLKNFYRISMNGLALF
jgi:hypothetical protein